MQHEKSETFSKLIPCSGPNNILQGGPKNRSSASGAMQAILNDDEFASRPKAVGLYNQPVRQWRRYLERAWGVLMGGPNFSKGGIGGSGGVGGPGG